MLRTPKEVREDFARKGLAYAEWARAHGYDAALTRLVVNEKRAALRGQCHDIAVALGLKHGEIVKDRNRATAINA